jgi:hypothetical protein
MEKTSTKLCASLIALTVIFGSCKKNDNNYDYRKASPSIELPIAAHAGPASLDNGGFKFGVSEFISTTPQPLTTTVLVAGPAALKKAVTVTLAVDNTAITKLNAAHRALYVADSLTAVKNATDLPDPTLSQYTTYVLLPANTYTVPSSTVTIPAGQLTANYTINLTTSSLTLGTNYMLPVSITDAQGEAISYYKTVYYIITIASKYEGDYTANGSIVFPPPQEGRSWSDRDKELTTINGNTVLSEAADLGGSNYYMYLMVNADNSVTVTPKPGAANQTIQNNGPCTYDPATKTFTLSYKYIGGTGNRLITETIAENN